MNDWADALGYTRQRIAAFEVDEYPGYDLMRRAADLADVPVDWMELGFDALRPKERPALAALRATAEAHRRESASTPDAPQNSTANRPPRRRRA